jgi:hypothetical protein
VLDVTHLEVVEQSLSTAPRGVQQRVVQRYS